MNQFISARHKIALLLSSSLLITACNHDDDDASSDGATFSLENSQYVAVIATRASDYSSGDYALINTTNYTSKLRNTINTPSDTAVSTNEDDIYQFGKFGIDTISKFKVTAPESEIWDYSTNDTSVDDINSSNPYKIVFASNEKAYIIRYGSDQIWIVNPEASTRENFRLGVLDLSPYADDDFTPEPAEAIVVDGKIYIAIQRQERPDNFDWNPGLAYIAVFDTSTDLEIETNVDSATPKGIALSLRNPSVIKYLSSNNSLYVNAVGRTAATWIPRDAEYTGGIEQIDLSDYSTSVLIDDGDSETNIYGNFNNVAVLNSTRGYFVGHNKAGDNMSDLYEFNPTTGDVASSPIIAATDIADIEIGPYGDLWVANATDSGVTIISTFNNEVRKDLISTELVPINIEFVSLQD